MKNYQSKKIWLTPNKEKWCIVRVYPTKKAMNEAYHSSPHKNVKGKDADILGAHCGYTRFVKEVGQRMKCSGETGTVFLCREHLGAGVVSHELMHAVIWARTHRPRWKEQYPVVIKNIQEEETLLHNLTYAIKQFYDFYWKKLDGK